MPTKQPQLAKLTRPRLHKAVARERLYSLLDEAREHKPAICVVGPPGAGKTTLIASWLDARDIKGIWYQVDPGDGDLSTFFYYLSEAARAFARKGQRPLPLLTPEYLQDVEGFSRRFFRNLFPRLPAGGTLVLDNYQEIEADERFHKLVAEAVNEIPVGQTLLAISRRDPPDCYARMLANEKVRLVEWEDLRFTIEEVGEVITARGRSPKPEETQRWLEISDGWAAGLTLMLEDHRRSGEIDSAAPIGHEAVFRYFAGHIFANVPEHIQRFLMATAYMSQVQVSVARALTGRPDAAAILEDLYRRHLFTHRRPAQEETYWYHALYRTFLIEQCQQRLEADGRNEIKRRAAELLDAHGSHEDAFRLFCTVEDWDAAEKLILRQASLLLEQGRGQTLRDWLDALPQKRLDAQPRLHYWFGLALMATNLEEARQHLENAFDQFSSIGDITLQIHAAAGIVDTWYYAWAQFQPMTPWAQLMGELIEKLPRFDSVEAELHVYSSWLLSMLFGDPGHPMLSQCVRRVSEMLNQDLDPNSKVMAGAFLLTYCVLGGEISRAAEVKKLIAPVLMDPSVSPMNQMWWSIRDGYYLLLIGRCEEGNHALDEADALAREHGLGGLAHAEMLIVSYQLIGAAYVKDIGKARRCVDRILQSGAGQRPSESWLTNCSRVHLAYLKGDLQEIRIVASAMIDGAERTGMRYIEILSHLNVANALCALGIDDELVVHLDTVRSLFQGTCFAYFEAEVRMLEAWSHFARLPNENGRRILAEALRYARETDYAYFNCLRYSPVLPHLFAEALRSEIEVVYVKQMIGRLRVSPLSEFMECWPWAVKIYSLGRYEIYRNEERLEFSGKVPKKPLMLLKALIAFGGRSVPEERLMDALWPDEEADAARKSLDITVLRLRKLLGGNDSIIVSDELIGLNPQICWTDVWAFEARVAQTEVADGDGRSAAASAALSLYRGDFLPADAEEPWTLKVRERLRAKFVRLVESVAHAEEAAGQLEKAMAHYLKGLEADELVEAFHIGLMRCYRALGRPAEAMTTYRRLRQTLSVVLGIKPSPAAETLAKELRESSSVHYP